MFQTMFTNNAALLQWLKFSGTALNRLIATVMKPNGAETSVLKWAQQITKVDDREWCLH